MTSDVRKDGILRPIVNRPRPLRRVARDFSESPTGRLQIGRRLQACPTLVFYAAVRCRCYPPGRLTIGSRLTTCRTARGVERD